MIERFSNNAQNRNPALRYRVVEGNWMGVCSVDF